MTKSHTHPNTDELFIFKVPADESEPMEIRVIEHSLDAMQREVGGYIEQIDLRLNTVPALPCDCRLRMIANEDGVPRRMPVNKRASIAAQGWPIKGDIFFIGEGPVDTQNGIELGWFSLPEHFKNWAGPGHEYPSVDDENKS